jgi:hypothetical protein
MSALFLISIPADDPDEVYLRLEQSDNFVRVYRGLQKMYGEKATLLAMWRDVPPATAMMVKQAIKESDAWQVEPRTFHPTYYLETVRAVHDTLNAVGIEQVPFRQTAVNVWQ